MHESAVLPENGHKVRAFGSKKFRKPRNWGLTSDRTSARITHRRLERVPSASGFAPCKLNNEEQSTRRKENPSSTGDSAVKGISLISNLKIRKLSFNKTIVARERFNIILLRV